VSSFDRYRFALAYADTLDTTAGHESSAYAAALREHRAALLAGLERLFGLRLAFDTVPDRLKPILMVLRSTARSYLAIQGPLSSYLEAGLIFTRLREVGAQDSVERDLDRIEECNTDSRAAHTELMATLLGVLLGDNADRVVSEDELHAIGVHTDQPDPNDYDEDPFV
jgi:hypothetical protein